MYRAVASEFPDTVIERVVLRGFAEAVGVARLEGAPHKADAVQSPRVARDVQIATTITALLSARCFGFVALNGAALALELGVVGAGALGTFFDQSVVRLPLLVAATSGALAILYSVRWTLPFVSRPPPDSAAGVPIRHERWRNLVSIALACTALVLVAGEVIAHAVMH